MHERVEKRLFLIDGYGFVFRAYHSMPPLTNPEGTPVGAVYGFTNMLIKLKNKVRTANTEEAFLICVFDAGKDTFRNEIYKEYKANRPPAPDDLIPQFPLVREAATALSIETVEMEGFEADDIIATYTKLAQEKGIHVTIVSSDKDLMQLVTDDVKMYDGMRDKIIGIDQVKEKFGVAPNRVLDVLSLMGDSSDNIPGIPGVGPKTAAELVNQFGDLDNVLNSTAQITKKKLKENLETYKQDAILSRQLASLKYDVGVDANFDKFKIKDDNKDILVPFLRDNGFKSLLAKVEGGFSKFENKADGPKNWGSGETKIAAPAQIKTEERAHTAPQKINNETKINEFSHRAELAAWLPVLNECKKLSLVFANEVKQSSSGSPRNKNVARDDGYYIQIAKSGHEACVLKPMEEEIFHHVSTDKQTDLFSATNVDKQKTFKPYFEVLKPYLESGSCNFVFDNYKSATKLCRFEPGSPAASDDALIMNYAVNGTSKDFKIAEENPALKIFNLHAELEQEIFNQKVSYIYNDIEKPLIEILSHMETAGIKVDKSILKGLSHEFNGKLKQLEKEIFVLANEEFNIGSPKQLGEVLFDHMGIQGGKKTKTGNYTTDSDVLETLEEQGHTIAGKVLEWRSFSKLINTYTEALVEEINENTGRVHTTFNQAATTTGRLSSTNPNLQNIPIRTEEGKKIRSAFVAEAGKKLISIDYSQIELRLLAHVADIEVLKKAFKDGKDIHSATAAQVFGVDINNVDGELRRRAKTINFGIIYGQSAFGLAKQLGIARGEAKTLIDKYFAQYPGIKRYMDETIQLAHEQGFVSTIWGRKIHLPGINDKNGAVRSFNERAAINAPLQGTAADIIKRAMIVIDKELKKSEAKLLLQIHDELIFECDESSAEQIAAGCKKMMEQVITLSVPLVADARVGHSWAEIH
jgi:DNA polymerase-1